MVKREENEDNICHWEECLAQYDTAEDLFNHICAAHIGRKSAGTLSLECKWTGCRAKASKRDHLTSHCRVHVALKPHVCSICTKAFKRPQDLKKHEKIHTEEHQAQHQRVSKAAAAGMNGNAPSGGGKLGAQPRGQLSQPAQAQTGAPASASISQLANPYQFSFPPLGFAYPGLAGAQQPQQAVAATATNGHHPQQQQQHAAAAHHLQQQQHQQPGQFPLGGANADQLAQFIALQQQLNSQAQMAAATGLSLPSSTIPNLQANLSGALAMQLNQMLGAQAMQYLQGVPAMYPYGGFGFSAAPNQQGLPPTGSHAALPSGMPAPHTTAAPQGSSLYPTLPQSLYAPNGSSSLPPPIPSIAAQQPQQQTSLHPMHRAAKPEEHPSPASSSRSQESGSYSSSLSPRNLPALSPASSLTPEGSFSPTPGPEQQRKLQSDNRVAGKKRGFEEATGQLLSNLTNKRFQDADAVNAQLDSLSSFLLTPDVHHQPLAPHGSYVPGQNYHDDAASSSGSENGSIGPRFEHEEVDAINQLLLSLNQTLDSELSTTTTPGAGQTSHLGDFHSLPGSAPQTSHGVHASQPPSAASAYPTLPATSLYPSLPAGLGYPNLFQHNGHQAFDPSGMLHQQSQQKSVPAPSLSHDYRPTQYHHVARLQRAAPSASAPPQIEPEMDIDEDVKDAAKALLLAGAVNRARSVPDSKPTLPSLTTAVGVHKPTTDLRLPPIVTATSGSARLPPIRDLLSFRSPSSSASNDRAESPISPVASSSSSSTLPLYPSLSSIQSSSSLRPVSAGGVERLTHRVHKLRLPSTSSLGDEPSASSVREDEADLSASSGEEDEDHPTLFKKSRVESPMGVTTPSAASERGSVTPEPLLIKKEEDADLDEQGEELDAAHQEEDKKADLARQELEARAKVIERRKAVIAYLAMYVNHKYREQLARKSMAQVRKAIKKPSPLSQEQQGLKAEH
ncbi:hypothetical protein JCM10908_003782 [Rhodotorula pacifica]|uniref:uncharacterized protein n=1 Tax=Rhodotorula pacifica TaxID=1495444 RepID=UPI003170E40D